MDIKKRQYTFFSVNMYIVTFPFSEYPFTKTKAKKGFNVFKFKTLHLFCKKLEIGTYSEAQCEIERLFRTHTFRLARVREKIPHAGLDIQAKTLGKMITSP